MKQAIFNFLEFFLVLTVMFLACSFLANLLMRRFSFQKIIASLERKASGLGNVLAACIGAITPFCVCTTIPIFTSMIQMGVSPNVAVSFLLASPLISISAAALIFFLFGTKFLVMYIVLALIVSILGGFLMRVLRLDTHITDTLQNTGSCAQEKSGSVCHQAAGKSFQLLKDMLIPLFIGALIAGLIHNYVPVKTITMINSYSAWLTIPLAALIGFPIYSNILVLAPICFSLAQKGMDQGALAAFLMSGAGVSFPTMIVLKSFFKTRLFLYYLLYTFIAYCAVGFVFHFLR